MDSRNTDHYNYHDFDDIEDEVVHRELGHYLGGIFNEIVQAQEGGYYESNFIKRQLNNIQRILDNFYDKG